MEFNYEREIFVFENIEKSSLEILFHFVLFVRVQRYSTLNFDLISRKLYTYIIETMKEVSKSTNDHVLNNEVFCLYWIQYCVWYMSYASVIKI